MRDFVLNSTKEEKLKMLKHAAEAFYMNDYSNSRLQDEEYDYLEKELGIRGLSLLGFKESKVRTMDSKTQVKDNFDEVVKSLKGTDNLPKWDGCSLVAYYKYIESTACSHLWKVISKSSGHDKTKGFSKFFPDKLPGEWKYLQGEALIDLGHGFGERSRQKANGLVNSKTKQKEIDKYITVMIFAGATPDKVVPGSGIMLQRYDALHNYSPLYHSEWAKGNKYHLPDGRSFLIDGVVAYGPEKIRGYKFYFTEDAETTIRKIKWQKSSYGNYSPVAVFDQVKIEGCKIEKASLGSVDKMIKIGAGIGSKIKVVRANSTIPKISEVITKSSDYGNACCPYCGTPFDLNKSIGGKVRCWNLRCSYEHDRMMKIVKKALLDPTIVSDKWVKSMINLERQKLSSRTVNAIKTMIVTISNDPSMMASPSPEMIPLDGLSSSSKKIMQYKLEVLCDVIYDGVQEILSSMCLF